METLLAHNQRTATSELGQQLIKLYVETRKLPTDAIIGAHPPPPPNKRSFGVHALNDGEVETIIRLFHAYGPEDVDDGRVSFLKAAIRCVVETAARFSPLGVDACSTMFVHRWTMAGQQDKNGDPRLHEVLADYYTSKR